MSLPCSVTRFIVPYFLLITIATVSACSFRTPNAGKTAELAVPGQGQNKSGPATSPLPQPTGFVNDYANVIDAESETKLAAVLAELKTKSDIELAVVTVDTTGGQPIFDYSLAVAKGWGIGPKDKSKGGGLLLMLAVKDRQWRLQVSRNLEKDLPDEVCKELGDQSLAYYKRGDYAAGISQYVKAIIRRLEKLRGFKLTREI